MTDLPTLEKIAERRDEESEKSGRSTVLVVAPTRELALQLRRDASSILSNLGSDPLSSESSVLLAVKGVDVPTAKDLNDATVLVGTPDELLKVLSGGSSNGASEFMAGNVLRSVILDENDVLLPNSPKVAGNNNDRKKKSGKAATPQEERRRLIQKRKLLGESALAWI